MIVVYTRPLKHMLNSKSTSRYFPNCSQLISTRKTKETYLKAKISTLLLLLLRNSTLVNNNNNRQCRSGQITQKAAQIWANRTALITYSLKRDVLLRKDMVTRESRLDR